MLTAGELADMRAESARALPDTCDITRETGEPVLDPDTGENTYPDPTIVYSGPCRVRAQQSQEQNTETGEMHATLAPYVATLPHTVDGVLVDDYLEVTASTDAGMVGRSFQIRHVAWGSWHLDRRLSLEDAEQPRDR